MRLALIAVTLVGMLAAAIIEMPRWQASAALEPLWGVTFSPRFAQSLGLDPRALYLDTLDTLGVRHVRFPVYWDEVEPNEGAYDFTALDWYLSEARARDVQVVLVVGYKQPRWPECYLPSWAVGLANAELHERILRLIEAEVRFAKAYPNVEIWQVENEPFRRYGECQPDVLTSASLADELELISRLDARPTLVTDSGELSAWVPAMRLSREYFGTTAYRQLHFENIGLWQHPLPAWVYPAKSQITRAALQKDGQTILVELQAEAWFQPFALVDIPPAVQQREFPAALLLGDNVEYGRRTRFSRVYLWGVEWWSWMGARGYLEYHQRARQIFRPTTSAPPFADASATAIERVGMGLGLR